jgi:hypothetical protein
MSSIEVKDRCLKSIPNVTMPCYLQLGHDGDHECYALNGPADRAPVHWKNSSTTIDERRFDKVSPNKGKPL